MDDQDHLGVGQLLRSARERRGMSARAVSIEAKLSPSYVNKLEAGDLDPSLRAFARLARVLQLTTMEILYVVGTLGADE